VTSIYDKIFLNENMNEIYDDEFQKDINESNFTNFHKEKIIISDFYFCKHTNRVSSI